MIALVLLLLRPAEAKAFPGVEVMGAVNGNVRSGYAFASLLSPAVDRRVTLLGRLTVSYLYYRHPDDGGETSVLSPGLGLGVGGGWRSDRLSLTLIAGYEARYVQTLPSTGIPEDRADHGVIFSADAYFQATARTALATSVSYGFSQDYLWARVLAKRQLLPSRGVAIRTFAMGVDATAHGNEQSRGVDGGIFGELSFPGTSTSLALRVGLGREIQPGAQKTLEGTLGVSIYKAF